jgi:hypothetical protein
LTVTWEIGVAEPIPYAAGSVAYGQPDVQAETRKERHWVSAIGAQAQ